jgi:hypothetical protein
MKNIVLIMVSMFLAISAQAGTITWGSLDLTSYGFTDGWLVALYEDVSADGFDATTINFSTGATDSDDVYLGITDILSTGKSGQGWASSFGSPNGSLAFGDSVVSVIFNSAALNGSATTAWYSTAFIGGLSANGGGQAILPGDDSPATYTVSGLTQVIPEPATALLFGIGGMGAWMVRRSKLKSKEEADA